jgi:hypothetical protein
MVRWCGALRYVALGGRERERERDSLESTVIDIRLFVFVRKRN